MMRLLFLGFSFPPGWQALMPGTNPAGHLFETQMLAALRVHCDIRSTTLLPGPSPRGLPSAADPRTGVAHELRLSEQRPRLWHRCLSIFHLGRQYRAWQVGGWRPDVVMTYNLSPVYNAFIRGLGRQASRPRRVLLLLDSTQLGQRLSPLKRFRYRFKPLVYFEDDMLAEFDAAIGASPATERFFQPLRTPFLWMPGGCSPERAPGCAEDSGTVSGGAIRFGYFGALAAHAGVRELVSAFRATEGAMELHVCGYGRLAGWVAEQAQQDSRLRFHGLLPTPEACLEKALDWDVLVNPRPAGHGNENNFPSKLFDYALCGRAILTTRLSGSDAVLGPEAFYFDPARTGDELPGRLKELAVLSRAELRRRGAALRERVTREYSWARQADRMAGFLKVVTHEKG
ncbi:MAG: glycosyltransferase [Verrucomicrobia bacterium]|nr:glycosyltransferase [Verrucomicrobiota bacterium]